MGFLTKPAIQSYTAPGGITPGRVGYIDNTLDRIVGYYNGDADQALFDFDSGTIITSQHLPDIGVFPGTYLPAIIASPSGDLWCPNDTGPTLEYCRIDPTTTPWTLRQQWGVGNVPTGASAANSMAWLAVGNAGWLVTGEALGGHIVVIQAYPSFEFGGNYFAASTSEDVQVCAGPQGAMSSTAYWLGGNVSPDPTFGKTVIQSSAALYDPATWPTPNGGITSSTIKSYAPTDFDAAWGAITNWGGPAYDQTDGNVIVQVSGTGGGNAYYIAKLSTVDGTVLWKVPIAGGGAGTGFLDGIQFSRIQNGIFLYYAQVSTFGGTLYAINTGDGSFATQATTGIEGFGQQASDDVRGCIIGNATWNSADGNLLLLNSTAGSGTSQLAAVYFIQSENEVVQLSAISYTRMFGMWQQ